MTDFMGGIRTTAIPAVHMGNPVFVKKFNADCTLYSKDRLLEAAEEVHESILARVIYSQPTEGDPKPASTVVTLHVSRMRKSVTESPSSESADDVAADSEDEKREDDSFSSTDDTNVDKKAIKY